MEVWQFGMILFLGFGVDLIESTDFYSLTVIDLQGNNIPMSVFKGKVSGTFFYAEWRVISLPSVFRTTVLAAKKFSLYKFASHYFIAWRSFQASLIIVKYLIVKRLGKRPKLCGCLFVVKNTTQGTSVMWPYRELIHMFCHVAHDLLHYSSRNDFWEEILRRKLRCDAVNSRELNENAWSDCLGEPVLQATRVWGGQGGREVEETDDFQGGGKREK